MGVFPARDFIFKKEQIPSLSGSARSRTMTSKVSWPMASSAAFSVGAFLTRKPAFSPDDTRDLNKRASEGLSSIKRMLFWFSGSSLMASSSIDPHDFAVAENVHRLPGG